MPRPARPYEERPALWWQNHPLTHSENTPISLALEDSLMRGTRALVEKRERTVSERILQPKEWTTDLDDPQPRAPIVEGSGASIVENYEAIAQRRKELYPEHDAAADDNSPSGIQPPPLRLSLPNLGKAPIHGAYPSYLKEAQL